MFHYFIDRGEHVLIIRGCPMFGTGNSLREALEFLVEDLQWLEEDVANPEHEGTEHPFYAQVCEWLQTAEACLENFEQRTQQSNLH